MGYIQLELFERNRMNIHQIEETMPTAVLVANTLKVEIRFNVFGQQCENVINVKLPSSPTIEVLTDVAEAVVSWWGDNGKLLVNSAVGLVAVKVTDLGETNGLSIEYTTGLPVVGTASGALAPLNVTAAIRLNTSQRGRCFTGRLFHVGIPILSLFDNGITADYLASLKASYEALIDLVNLVGGQVSIVSRVTGGAQRGTPVVTPVTGVFIDPLVDSQRRRLTGRGR